MRISDWSSDVCSSDLRAAIRQSAVQRQPQVAAVLAREAVEHGGVAAAFELLDQGAALFVLQAPLAASGAVAEADPRALLGVGLDARRVAEPVVAGAGEKPRVTDSAVQGGHAAAVVCPGCPAPGFVGGCGRGPGYQRR